MAALFNRILPYSVCIVMAFAGFDPLHAQESGGTRATSPLPAQEAGIFLSEMAQRLSRLGSLEADFVQKRAIAVFMDTLISSGFFCFRAPSFLRWEVLKDYHSILIFNGKNVAKFDFQNGKMRPMKLGTEDLMRGILGQIVFWMKGEFSSSSRVYDIAVFEGAPSRIVLRPKSDALRQALESITLSVDKESGRVIRVVIGEPGGDSVDITFSNDRTDIPLPDTVFDLVNPARRGEWMP